MQMLYILLVLLVLAAGYGIFALARLLLRRLLPLKPRLAASIALALGNLVDPPATMVNAAGDYVACYIVSRFVDGKDWLQKAMAKKNQQAT